MMSTYVVSLEGKGVVVELKRERVTLDGKEALAEVTRSGASAYSVLLDGHSYRVLSRVNGGKYDVLCEGVSVEAEVQSERTRLLKQYAVASSDAKEKSEVHAPMPALVVRVEVEPGEEVERGQGLIVLEAMKMENELKAARPGRVKAVLVQRGRPVEKGELLLVLE
jgi:biotin carboxyl carrier protein